MPAMTYDPESHAYTVDGKRVPSVTEIAGVLTASRFAASNASLEQAKRRGTEVHELCEYIDCGVDPDEMDVPPELVGYVNSYLAFLRDWNPEWLYIEKPLYTNDYAGRADRIGIIDGKHVIADIKTTANMDRLAKLTLALQLFGYTAAWEQMGNAEIDRAFGIQLKKDGTYTIHEQEKIREKYLPAGMPLDGLFYRLLSITNIIGGYNT